MIANPVQTERELMEQVVRNYEQAGYVVIAEPGAKDLPFDLDVYRPDLLVKTADDKGYIIEIKHKAEQTSVDRLREVARTVSTYPGWRFLLITGEDTTANQPGNGQQLLSERAIRQRWQQANELVAQGSAEAGFLSLWTVLEAWLRTRAETDAIPIERFPYVALVKHLYSQGELSMEAYDSALVLSETRNRLVHGFQIGALDKAVSELQQLVSELLNK